MAGPLYLSVVRFFLLHLHITRIGLHFFLDCKYEHVFTPNVVLNVGIKRGDAVLAVFYFTFVFSSYAHLTSSYLHY